MMSLKLNASTIALCTILLCCSTSVYAQPSYR